MGSKQITALKAIRSTETRTFNGGGCPLQTLYEWEAASDGVPLPVISYYVRGNVGHEAIEVSLLTGDPDAGYQVIEDFVNKSPLMEEEWIETSKCTKEGIYNELVQIHDRWIDQMFEHYEVQGLTVAYVEALLECETPNGTPLSTTTDAIFLDYGKPVVVDWKLGTSKSGQDMQLYVYWYIMKKMGLAGEHDEFNGWFHYVNYQNPIAFDHLKYPGDKFVEAYVDEAYSRKINGPYLPNPSWFSCTYCRFRDNCPLYDTDPVGAWDYITNIEVNFV